MSKAERSPEETSGVSETRWRRVGNPVPWEERRERVFEVMASIKDHSREQVRSVGPKPKPGSWVANR